MVFGMKKKMEKEEESQEQADEGGEKKIKSRKERWRR